MIVSFTYSDVLDEFFEKLKEDNIRFCVLSDPVDLTTDASAKDIDILIPEKERSRTVGILKAVFKKFGSEKYTARRFKGMHSFLFFSPGENGSIIRSLKIDLFTNFEFRGRIFLTSKEILENTIPCKNFFIPGTIHKAFMALMKGIMKGGSAWEGYMPKIEEGFRTNPGKMNSFMRRVFREKTVRFLSHELSRGNVEEIEKVRKRLILETYVVSFSKKPIGFPFHFLAHYLIAGSRIMCPPNYMIALLGPDGVGKSTLIDHIRKDINDLLKFDPHMSKSFHIRPGLFPTITELIKRKGTQGDGDTSLPVKVWHSDSVAISFVRLLCFWFDYFLGYIVKILPELGNHHVVILDRYFYDLLIDPSRYKIRLSYKVMRGIFVLLPQPKVVIVLDAPAETIRNRKKELDITQIELLRNKYRSLKSDFANIHILDATRSPETLSREVVSTFINSTATALH